MDPSQESYIFANFYRDRVIGGNLEEFRVRNKVGLRKRVFSSRIDRIIYSMERKISISRTRKESCLKKNPLSVTLHQYKLQPTNGSISLRPSLALTYRKIKTITK